MPVCKTPLEFKLYAALKRITRYDTAERLLKHGERDWGCSGEEALEMSYENIQHEAKSALRGVRLPKGWPLHNSSTPTGSAAGASVPTQEE